MQKAESMEDLRPRPPVRVVCVLLVHVLCAAGAKLTRADKLTLLDKMTLLNKMTLLDEMSLLDKLLYSTSSRL